MDSDSDSDGASGVAERGRAGRMEGKGSGREGGGARGRGADYPLLVCSCLFLSLLLCSSRVESGEKDEGKPVGCKSKSGFPLWALRSWGLQLEEGEDEEEEEKRIIYGSVLYSVDVWYS